MIDRINESATDTAIVSSPYAIYDCILVYCVINTFINSVTTRFVKRPKRFHYRIILDPLVIQINKYFILIVKSIVID